MTRVVRFPNRQKESEWLGGRYTLPHEVRDGDFAFRPDVLLWLELPTGVIVGSALTDPRQPVSLGQSLQDAMQDPLAGSPRRPSRIRVADQRTADELRAVAAGIPIVVAPVPELQAAVDALTEALGDSEPEPSYLGEGEIEPRLVGELFKTAGLLFRTAPWRLLSDQQILRVDVPRFGIDGAVISIIGEAGESFGLMLFNSIDDFDEFLRSAERRAPAAGATDRLAVRSLSFDRKEDLPPSMLREIEQHGWRVADANGYPAVLCIGADLIARPATEKDVRILTAVTRAFLAFFAQHRDMFDEDEPEPVRETSAGEDGVKVTITAPYVVFDDEAPTRTPAMRDVGRNDPCPCGSGKKYKKCHLDADQEPRRTASETVHEMDFRLVRAISQFAARQFGPDWLEYDPDDENEDALQLVIPWSTWTAEVDGVHVAGAYRAEYGTRLSADEHEWFAAQERSWLSVWEATAVEPGRIDVRDLLTGEVRSVREEAASQTVVPRDTLLARVIDYRGQSYFGGMYARSLSPAAGAAVADVLRRALRKRKTPVPLKRLRDPEIGRSLIDHWSAEIAHEDALRSKPPTP